MKNNEDHRLCGSIAISCTTVDSLWLYSGIAIFVFYGWKRSCYCPWHSAPRRSAPISLRPMAQYSSSWASASAQGFAVHSMRFLIGIHPPIYSLIASQATDISSVSPSHVSLPDGVPSSRFTKSRCMDLPVFSEIPSTIFTVTPADIVAATYPSSTVPAISAGIFTSVTYAMVPHGFLSMPSPDSTNPVMSVVAALQLRLRSALFAIPRSSASRASQSSSALVLLLNRAGLRLSM